MDSKQRQMMDRELSKAITVQAKVSGKNLDQMVKLYQAVQVKEYVPQPAPLFLPFQKLRFKDKEATLARS